MRTAILGVAAALGLALGAADAKAQVIQNGFQFGNMGQFNQVGVPIHRFQVTPFGFRQQVFFPGAQSIRFSPFAFNRVVTGPSLVTRQFHPIFGFSSQVITPNQFLFNNSALLGVRSFTIPSTTFTTGFNPFFGLPTSSLVFTPVNGLNTFGLPMASLRPVTIPGVTATFTGQPMLTFVGNIPMVITLSDGDSTNGKPAGKSIAEKYIDYGGYVPAKNIMK